MSPWFSELHPGMILKKEIGFYRKRDTREMFLGLQKVRKMLISHTNEQTSNELYSMLMIKGEKDMFG